MGVMFSHISLFLSLDYLDVTRSFDPPAAIAVFRIGI